MQLVNKWKIGFDPEYFISNSKGKIINAIPVLNCDKNNPIVLGKGINIYADNCLLESTVPVSGSKREMLTNLRKVYKSIQNRLGNNYKIVPKAAHKFNKAQMKDKKAWEIGCTPSFNVWERKANKTQSFRDTTRTSAGHIHISHPNLGNFETRENTIKLLDIVLGTSLVVLGQDKTAGIRRQLYGKAGEFRFEGTRAEYRVPDSFYLRSPETTSLVYDIIDYTLHLSFSGKGKDILARINPNMVRDAINGNNKKLAKEILYQVKIPNSLMKRIVKPYKPELYRDWGV